MNKFRSTKRFSGYSTCFRQWRANSHCKHLHGYALEFLVTFEGELDERNWVMDFGAFKDLGFKDWMSERFDHKTVVASDDPKLDLFRTLYNEGVIQMVIMDDVGCEKFAEYVKRYLDETVPRKTNRRVTVHSVQCIENPNNSAICYETFRY